ncbi:MAG: GNAT family N-acetyltransferase [Flavobacteriales bacterium]|nr:GNAT family N-acetyltransferase [Flavobacteriales bacterium]
MLEGSRIKIRLPEPADVDVLHRWENDPEIMRAGESAEPISRDALVDFLKAYETLSLSDAGQQRWMICDIANGNVLGTLDLFEYSRRHGRAGIGILIGEQESRAKGFASEALRLFLPFASSELGLLQLWCLISPSNKASIRLFEKNGFVKTGEHRQWVQDSGGYDDRWFYQCLEL